MSRVHFLVGRPLGQLQIPAFVAALALGACGPKSAVSPAYPQKPGSEAGPATVMVTPGAASPVAAPAPAVAPAPSAEAPIVLKDVGFMTPESVLYDAEQDVYLVSNINGKPTDADGNGFISRVSPEGKVLELKWIDGTKAGSALNAPKGLAVSGGLLYVADLTFVRLFDRKTGAPKGKIAAAGSTFLNDIAVGADGTVYVSDSGLKLGKDGFEPTGTDAIYKIGKAGRADKLIADKETLGRPNGLLADDKGVWAVTFGSGALYHVDSDGKKGPDQKLPSGSLDGLVKLSDGTLLVSSWAASSVFRGTAGGEFTAVIHDVKSPADIGYDTKRDVVLIPLFQVDAVQLQKLPGGPPAAAKATPAPAAPSAPAAKAAPAPAAPSAPAAKAAPAPAAPKP